jgi:Rad3-related DNA helicase
MATKLVDQAASYQEYRFTKDELEKLLAEVFNQGECRQALLQAGEALEITMLRQRVENLQKLCASYQDQLANLHMSFQLKA